LHGDLSQPQRDAVMKKFRDRKIQVLIATDIAARGIDVDNVTHVLHCNLPDDIENYTHRSGRTARAGKSGVSIIIGTSLRKIKMLETELGIIVNPVQVPTGEQLCHKQLEHFASTLKNSEIDELVKRSVDHIKDNLLLLPKEELIERMVALHCGQMLHHYKKANNLNAPAYDRGGRTEVRGQEGRSGKSGRSGGRSDSTSYRSSGRDESRLFINIGKMDRMTQEGLIKFIASTAAVDGKCLSRISMQNTRSFFTVEDSKKAQVIVRALKASTIKGRRIQVDFEQPR